MQTLFHVWLIGPNALQSSLSVWKEMKEAGENPDSSVSSVGAKSPVGARISMIPLSEERNTGEELHDDHFESTNAKSVIRLDIGCITDELPSQAKI